MIGYYVVLAMVVVACVAVLIYLIGHHEAVSPRDTWEKDKDE